MSRAFTATPNDDGTVSVQQSGSEVELDFTPEMVEDSSLTNGEKRFVRSLFADAHPFTGGGSCPV